ncbi:alpha-galactosidase [Akanthomyces lecanii RCEF 1005]|uniref:Acyl-coenzyme A diphosphatase SCS3 n=1 Tax=Akanthomyces lecanii RCEF 1005 TaxID=1081108 RepID=A0A168F149_CORDF|nr:alpha-galactosidase [Akanthomyces lecanii RCEF 1005]
MATTTKRAGRSSAANAPSTASPPTDASAMTSATQRTSPFLPTPVERLALGLFPVLLVFGSLFAVLSPHTRALTYDAVSQSLHAAADGSAPGYFARKSNLFNLYFVKRGWGWTTAALLAFVLTHPSVGVSPAARARAVARWAAVTAWWVLVVQWCFGAPIIDRGFRWTGGQCDLAELGVATGTADAAALMTAVACKASGGKWRGGHDISGHVFLLTLGSALLMNEVLWPLARWAGWWSEERCVVMADGALKGASVEAETAAGAGRNVETVLGYGGKFALGVLGLNLWMLLMTAIYFHTWFEKFTGLLTAYIAIYAVYFVPRFVPALRQIFGIPGI